jgi:hypothetical protein
MQGDTKDGKASTSIILLLRLNSKRDGAMFLEITGKNERSGAHKISENDKNENDISLKNRYVYVPVTLRYLTLFRYEGYKIATEENTNNLYMYPPLRILKK